MAHNAPSPGRPLAVCFHIMCKPWTNGSPLGGRWAVGNLLKRRTLETQTKSWARYGMTEGARRLFDIVTEAGILCITYASGIIA